MLPGLSFRGAKRRGNLGEAVALSPGLSCVPACTARLPRPLRGLAMTSQGGFPHPEGRNDKPESASFPCHCEEGASPTWQSREGTALRNEPSSKRQPPPTCHCEEAQPTWQSREGTSSSYKVPIKTYQPIASVAALSERLAGWQYSGHVFYGMRPPSLSFRGAKRRGNLLQQPSNSPRLSCHPTEYCEIATAPSGPRNDKSENRCGRRAASANPYAISGNCYISQSADKSTHLGFIVAISASFLLRDQLFICFSRSIAALTSGVVSK